MEFKIAKSPRPLASIIIKSDSDRRYRAKKILGGRGDWKYEITQINANGDEIANIGLVVIDRPTDIIDRNARKAEVLQAIGNKIAEHEQRTMQVVKT
jgi:hypothetical protein